MSRINAAATINRVYTYEGAEAYPHMKPLQALRRGVLSCMLWEKQFYCDGKEIADFIAEQAALVTPEQLASLAWEARTQFNLRHAPLLLLAILTQRGKGALVSDAIAATIQRADELAEFLAIYAKVYGIATSDLKTRLQPKVKRGLARAFNNFDAYQLAKYSRDTEIKLRDVAFLCHVAPSDGEQGRLLANLVNKDHFPNETRSAHFRVKETYGLDGDPHLDSPDTWEVALSAGADKKATFERLIREERLGYLALLRNLRNMVEANVDRNLIGAAIVERKGARRVLPFRYVAAAKHAPSLEQYIDQAFMAAIDEMLPLSGKTIILVDVSGSMNAQLSGKSDMTRMHAAAALASMVTGDIRVLTFSGSLVEVPARRGMAGVDAIIQSQPHGGTWLGRALADVNAMPHDRLIVISDEQSHDAVPSPSCAKAYMINVASDRNGIGYGRWTHLDGFSESVLRFIQEFESNVA